MQFAAGSYVVSATLGEPAGMASLVAHARLHERLMFGELRSHRLVVTAARSDAMWPSLVVELAFSPGPDAGFTPGLLLVEETGLLFVGAGTRLFAYDIADAKRLWEDSAEAGFWEWRRHGDVVVMSAELELAAFDLRGTKLWTTFVEPPWTYEVVGPDIRVDVMSSIRQFSLQQGPEPVGAG